VTAEDDGRRLSSVPAPGTSATPKPAPPRSGSSFPSNPLLNFLHGPDTEGRCPACRWVKAHLGFEPCPHHAAWQAIVVRVVDRVGDLEGAAPPVYPTTQPKFSLGERLWFQGKLQVKIKQRYWGGDGRWRYIAKGTAGGAAVDAHEDFFTREYDAAWVAPKPDTRRHGA
jgi:hypothetical protein